MMLRRGVMPSPLGVLHAVMDETHLLALDFEENEGRMLRLLARYHGVQRLVAGAVPGFVRDAIEAYFGGARAALAVVPVRMGGSGFQMVVWSALRGIPAGATMTYGGLAERMEAPRAVRAVGAANGANPVNLVIPCHRLVGRDGRLTGYSGGLGRKAWLLRHEGISAL